MRPSPIGFDSAQVFGRHAGEVGREKTALHVSPPSPRVALRPATQVDTTGHSAWLGSRGVQTSAVRSITAHQNRRRSVLGERSITLFSNRRDRRSESWRANPKYLERKRRTLVSMRADRSPNANTRTAAATYGPTPGKLCRSSCPEGTRPWKRSSMAAHRERNCDMRQSRPNDRNSLLTLSSESEATALGERYCRTMSGKMEAT